MEKHERLTTKGSNYYDDTNITCAEEIYEQLKDLEDKIENGTLKDTHVKVGDTIYYAKYYNVDVDNDIKGIEIFEPWKVERIDIYKDYIIYRLTHSGTDDYNTARDNEFGYDWFTDREKAHEHIEELKELQNGT